MESHSPHTLSAVSFVSQLSAATRENTCSLEHRCCLLRTPQKLLRAETDRLQEREHLRRAALHETRWGSAARASAWAAPTKPSHEPVQHDGRVSVGDGHGDALRHAVLGGEHPAAPRELAPVLETRRALQLAQRRRTARRHQRRERRHRVGVDAVAPKRAQLRKELVVHRVHQVANHQVEVVAQRCGDARRASEALAKIRRWAHAKAGHSKQLRAGRIS
eukprot:6189505-Pleurochrysis_carterae.AAC.2